MSFAPADAAPVRYLVVSAHPLGDSFHAAIRACACAALTAAGHDVDECDLYAEAFDPVMSAAERADYADAAAARPAVAGYIERLRRCEAILFIFPTWYYGAPAILKGYLDRVWLPGVAFTIDAGRIVPRLRHIRRFGVITTYGSPWWLNRFVLGDPGRKAFMRGLRRLVSPGARTMWLALYGMDSGDAAARAAFLAAIRTRLSAD